MPDRPFGGEGAEGTVRAWEVIAENAYVRNKRNWVIGVLEKGSLIVGSRERAGKWVRGRATAWEGSVGFKGRGYVLIYDKDVGAAAGAGKKVGRKVLKPVRVPAQRAALGAVAPQPKVRQFIRYRSHAKKNRAVKIRAHDRGELFLDEARTEPLRNNQGVQHSIRKGERIGVRYLTKLAAMIRTNPDENHGVWGFVARGCVSLEAIREREKWVIVDESP